MRIKPKHANILDAASEGSVTAVFLVGAIAGSLISMLAFMAFVNGVLGWAGRLAGVEALSLEGILGWLFIPLAWIMGVEHQDLEEVGTRGFKKCLRFHVSGVSTLI